MDPNEYHYVMTIRWSDTEVAPDGETPVEVVRYATDSGNYQVDPGDTADFIYTQILDYLKRRNGIRDYHTPGDTPVAVVNWTLIRNQGLYTA